MLIKILLVLSLLLIAFLIYAAFRPGHFRIVRALSLNAAPEAIFPQVNDLKKAAVWSPWLKLDPNVQVAYAGAAEGVGAISTWKGNNNIGEGRQEISESRPNELVRVKLEFYKPMAGIATVDYTLKQEGSGTVVSWIMYGDNSYLGKIVCIFMNQDKMCGDQFEKGLAALKAQVEGAPAK